MKHDINNFKTLGLIWEYELYEMQWKVLGTHWERNCKHIWSMRVHRECIGNMVGNMVGNALGLWWGTHWERNWVRLGYNARGDNANLL